MGVHATIRGVEEKQIRLELPDFRVGDTVRVNVKIVEGDKERVQTFEGVVIRIHRGGARATFTVRKVSYGVGVERIFPLHSPRIDSIEVAQRGRVRQARLYYLRQRMGKAARIAGERTASAGGPAHGAAGGAADRAADGPADGPADGAADGPADGAKE